MFFNFKGAFLIICAIVLVALVCLVDLKCSFMRDEKARERSDAPSRSGAIAHVTEELNAGKLAWAQQREEQLNEQLRMFRAMAKKFTEAGEHKRARAAIAVIQEIEREKARRR